MKIYMTKIDNYEKTATLIKVFNKLENSTDTDDNGNIFHLLTSRDIYDIKYNKGYHIISNVEEQHLTRILQNLMWKQRHEQLFEELNQTPMEEFKFEKEIDIISDKCHNDIPLTPQEEVNLKKYFEYLDRKFKKNNNEK